MKLDLCPLIDTFAKLKVLVIGDAMLDSYLAGSSNRLCPEAPAPIVAVSSREDVPGGAANTAVNVARLGGQVTFLSVIGHDWEGTRLQQLLTAYGVLTQHLLLQSERQTLAKHRVLSDSQILVRFDQGSTDAIAPSTEQLLINHLIELFPQVHAVIVSDYGYGTLTPRIIQILTELQTQHQRTLVVDAKNLPAYREIGVTAVKPNYDEAMRLLGIQEVSREGDRAAKVIAHQERLLRETGAWMVAVTLDTDGAIILSPDQAPYRTYAQPTPHSRAIGAGDTFISTVALAIAAGASTIDTAELAAAAASIVVAKEGTAACSAEELRTHLTQNCSAPKIDPTPAIATLPSFNDPLESDSAEQALIEALRQCLACYRQQGKRIVFTNGCFDILHSGHVTYLQQAKALGDVLVIGINSDDSVKRLKGASRPINSLDDRIQVLSALNCVDHVIPFADNTPIRLIQAICPDVYVKGGDYCRETLPETPVVEALGGIVKILPYVQNRSTTRLIQRIREVVTPSVPLQILVP